MEAPESVQNASCASADAMPMSHSQDICQKSSVARAKAAKSSGGSKGYLHSGSTPRLSDLTNRSRCRGSIHQPDHTNKSRYRGSNHQPDLTNKSRYRGSNHQSDHTNGSRYRGSNHPNFSKGKDKISTVADTGSNPSSPLDTQSTSHDVSRVHGSIHEYDGDGATRRRLNLTSAQRRWRSSDRLHLQKHEGHNSQTPWDSESPFYNRHVVNVTGNRPRVHSEPPDTVNYVYSGDSDKSNRSDEECTENDILSVTRTHDLHCIVKSEDDCNRTATFGSDEALSGHPFILPDEITSSHIVSKIPDPEVKSYPESNSRLQIPTIVGSHFGEDNNNHGKVPFKDSYSKHTEHLDDKSPRTNVKSTKKHDENTPSVDFHSLEPMPPTLARNVWCVSQSGQTERAQINSPGSTPVEDKDALYETPVTTRTVRHWANIEHRATTRKSVLSNLENEDKSSRLKSKSTWRIHAARARESVASLLNLTKEKDNSLTIPTRRLNPGSKFHPHHKSSPCLDLTPLQTSRNVLLLDSKAETPPEAFEKQTSSPDLYHINRFHDNGYNEGVAYRGTINTHSSLEENEKSPSDKSVSSRVIKEADVIDGVFSDSANDYFMPKITKQPADDDISELLSQAHIPSDVTIDADNLSQPLDAQAYHDSNQKEYSTGPNEMTIYKAFLLTEDSKEFSDSLSLTPFQLFQDSDVPDAAKDQMSGANTSPALLLTQNATDTNNSEYRDGMSLSDGEDSPAPSAGLLRTLTAAQKHLSAKKSNSHNIQIEESNRYVSEHEDKDNNETFGVQEGYASISPSPGDHVTPCIFNEDNTIETIDNSDSSIHNYKDIRCALDKASTVLSSTDDYCQGKTSGVDPLDKNFLRNTTNDDKDACTKNPPYVLSFDGDHQHLPVQSTENECFNQRAESPDDRNEISDLNSKVNIPVCEQDINKNDHCVGSDSNEKVKYNPSLRNVAIGVDIENYILSNDDAGSELLEEDITEKEHNIQLDDQRFSTPGDYPSALDDGPTNIWRQRRDSISSVSSTRSFREGRKGGGRRERSKRVEYMLNHQLFQKHLAKHAETIEKRVFGVSKKGLRKAFSSVDLSADQSELLGDVISSIFNSDATHTDESVNGKESDVEKYGKEMHEDSSHPTNKISRCVSLYDNTRDTEIDGDPNFDADNSDSNQADSNKPNGKCLRKAASSFLLRNNPNNTPKDSDCPEANSKRRASMVCTSSVQKSQHEAFMYKRQRIHIPSFSEYKQKRHFATNSVSDDFENSGQDTSVGGIYVIDENENDEVGLLDAKDRDSELPKAIKISDTPCKGKKQRRRKSVEESPIFAHPAIVITTEHCSKLKSGVWSSESRLSKKGKNKDKRQNIESEPTIDSIPSKINAISTANETDYVERADCFLDPTKHDDNYVPLIIKSNEGDVEERQEGYVDDHEAFKSREKRKIAEHDENLRHNSSLETEIQSGSSFDNCDFDYTRKAPESECLTDSPKVQLITNHTDFSHHANGRTSRKPPDITDPAVAMCGSLGFSIHNTTSQSLSNAIPSVDVDDGLTLSNSKDPNSDSHQPFSSSNELLPSPDMDIRESALMFGVSTSKIEDNISCRELEGLRFTRNTGPKMISVDVLELADATADVFDDDDQCDDVIGAHGTMPRWSPTNSASDSDQSSKTPVLRSTSDVSASEKERRRRDRKERPYKSDPFTGPAIRPPSLLSPDTPMRNSCLSVSTSCSFHSLDELDEPSDCNSVYDEDDTERRKRLNRLSNASTASEDSGVSGPGWNDCKFVKSGGCIHCAAFAPHDASSPSSPMGPEFESLSFVPTSTLCSKCLMKKRERKETIQEMAETEKRYGRDLAILKDEFYRPMKSTSLLTLDQLDAIFMNLDELLTVHKHFMGKLTSALVNAVKEGDEYLSSVDVGGIFVESSNMFLAFENYCVHQSQSSALLEQLEKEKELLKVFLQAAQNENPKLRRMHLKTFLMVPVQRVMKYPLLLGRLHRVTPRYHGDITNIRQARDNIEDILEHINSKTRSTSRPKSRSLQIQGYSLSEKIEVNRVSLDLLGWSKRDVCDIITSRLYYGQVPDSTWASRRARNVKFSMVHAALLSHGRPTESPVSPRELPHVLQVAMVLVREKGGKYVVVREPLLMDRCVVTVDCDYDHVFEIHEQGKDTYLFKAEARRETNTWIGHLKQLSRHLGYWRRRRNGLPNVLLKTS